MTRDQAKKIHEAINTALQGIKIPGVYFTPVNSVSYGAGRVTARIEARMAAAATEGGLSQGEIEEMEFARHAAKFGLQATDYNRSFLVNGSSYKLCGIKPKSYKYPFIGKSQRGARYKFTVVQVKSGMGIPLSEWDKLTPEQQAESRREMEWEARVS